MMYTLVKDLDEIRVITVLVEVVQFSNYEDVFARIKSAISDFTNLIVLDLSRVKFMDSLSLGMLVPLLLYTRRLGGDMAIATGNEKIVELFNILQLDKVLRIFNNVGEAAAFLRREGPTDGDD